MLSKKPYYIRALYDWILDNEWTPYILVNANYPNLEIPLEHVQNGRIVFNISPDACRGLHMKNDKIVFTARFSGKSVQIFLHPGAVSAIYAQENGEGKEFGREYDDLIMVSPNKNVASVRKKPTLTLVKANSESKSSTDE